MPADVLPPGGMTRFQLAWVNVTAAPDWLNVAFQAFVTRWSPPNVNRSVQSVIGAEPVLVIVTLATKPPGHWALTV
jgi:hypothetical protein